jgi:hypothetical protein
MPARRRPAACRLREEENADVRPGCGIGAGEGACNNIYSDHVIYIYSI